MILQIKKIISATLTITILSGCASQPQPKFDENAAELLKPSEVPVELEEKKTEKNAEETEHGIGYYVAVPIIVTVGFLGRLGLESFASHPH